MGGCTPMPPTRRRESSDTCNATLALLRLQRRPSMKVDALNAISPTGSRYRSLEAVRGESCLARCNATIAMRCCINVTSGARPSCPIPEPSRNTLRKLSFARRSREPLFPRGVSSDFHPTAKGCQERATFAQQRRPGERVVERSR